MTPDKPRRLGRGLEALISARNVAESTAADEREALRTIQIARIRPNPFQPRKTFDPQELQELEASLRANGLLNPIAVRPAPQGGGYELIAGERRVRAAARIGWTEIPAVVKQIDDRTLLTLALVENLQRADLNPMEEAEGYRQLMRDFALTQVQLAEAIGKERSTVANILRLLNLPASVQKMLYDRQLTLGHARALLTVEDEQTMISLAREIVAQGWSVREVEEHARQGAPPRKRRKLKERAQSPDAAVRQAEDELRRYLQTDVRIATRDAKRGKIEVDFYSTDDLERLLELMLGARRGA
jgi:ParB family transcriptional regulator, chromosome partitioning protein